MTILEKIVLEKRRELEERKLMVPQKTLQMLKGYRRTTLPVPEGFPAPFIIAEYKRRSPSKGDFASAGLSPVDVAKGYAAAGSSAISILTDSAFFGGSLEDLQSVREALPTTPLLRKDFIIDPYQVHESRAFGADIILLIASVLTPAEVCRLAGLAHELGLAVLLELHGEDEMGHYCNGIELVGINNRDLKTFDVDTDRSVRMLGLLPAGVPAVAESGLDGPRSVKGLHVAGFSGFLMGEYFMNSSDPGKQLEKLMGEL